MSLILHTLTLYQIADVYILIVDDIITFLYVGVKRMSISTAKHYIEIFARIFNFYQDKFKEKNSKIDHSLLGVEEEFKVVDFYPDIGTMPAVDHEIDSTDFFHCSTKNVISFADYGLTTVKKGGIIYLCKA